MMGQRLGTKARVMEGKSEEISWKSGSDRVCWPPNTWRTGLAKRERGGYLGF